jgi:hypothetical protein
VPFQQNSGEGDIYAVLPTGWPLLEDRTTCGSRWEMANSARPVTCRPTSTPDCSVGNDETRGESHQARTSRGQTCATCHGPEALWRYQYFHESRRGE